MPIMAVRLSNNATSTLAASVNSAVTSLSIVADDAAKFPMPGAGEWFPLTIIDDAGNMEILRCTERSGAALTVERGKEGTTAKSFAEGARVEIRLTTAVIADLVTLLHSQQEQLGTQQGELDAHTEALDERPDRDEVTEALSLLLPKSGGELEGQLLLPASTESLAPLRIPDGSVPSTLVDGDMWRSDAGGGLQLRKAGETVKILDGQSSIRRSVAIVADVKAQGTAPQVSASGNAWFTRNLNTEIYDPDGIVSLASNQFTLAAEANCIATIIAEVTNGGTNNSKVRLYNVTDGEPCNNHIFHAVATGAQTGVTGNPLTISAYLEGGKTYQVEHMSTQASVAVAGAANISGMNEIYLTVTLERIQHVIE